MVIGLNSFIAQFRDFADCYTVIGGAACDILMSEAGLEFRATKDVDMILVLEDPGQFTGFAERFWEYVRQGGYTCGWKNSDSVHFYRFTNPARPEYPVQIELFSRMPGYHLEVPNGIIPIHIDDQISSLSAILLDDEYYTFMLQGRVQENGLMILRPEYLIPFKMYAWLDFARKAAATPSQQKQYETNARRIITVWGPPVDDYASRIWNGLVGQYYLPRWNHYYASRTSGRPFEMDVWERHWVEEGNHFYCPKTTVDVASFAIEIIKMAKNL